jgi:hypothetical protein
MKLLSYETIDELKEAITKTIEGIPTRMLIGVSHDWRPKLEQCIQSEANHCE